MANLTLRRKLRPREFLVICERDGWICQICLKAVERGLEWPHPFSRSQEHTIPRSRDGVDDASNIRLAHLLCNQWKWARTDEEILGMTPPQPGEYDPVVMEMISQAKRAVLRERALERPWLPGQREQFILSMSEVWGSSEYRAALVDGQARRRTAEKAGERPMFSEAGREQVRINLAPSWSGEGHARAVAAAAELKRGAQDSEETKATKSASATLAYAEGRKKPVGRKLTEDDVREIRRVYVHGMSPQLAKQYGVSPQLIQGVANGKRWSHVA